MEYKLSPKVYILVLNYNNAIDTIECLDSLLALDYDNYTTVIIDNHSKDNSERLLKEWIKLHNDERFIFIQTGENKGYAGGNNIGIRYALKQGDMNYIWIINNDTILDKNALKEIILKFQKDVRLGICGSKMIYSWDKSKVQGYFGEINPILGTSKHIISWPVFNRKHKYVIGASLCLRREVILSIGLLEERYFLYFEEPDICLRAQKRGYHIDCATRSIVYHKEGASIGGGAGNVKYKSKLSDFYMIRNRILFTRKFYPYFIPTVYCGLLLTIFNRIKRKQYDRIKMVLGIMIHPCKPYV